MSEIDTDTLDGLEEVAVALGELVVELVDELLQAAAARHKASTTAPASPFLAT